MSKPSDRLPLSVLLVSEPGVDGVFHYVSGLARHLIARGIRTHLAYSTVRGAPALAALAEEVRGAGGQTLDLRVGNAPQAADLRALARLWRLARKVRPDVIHAHSSKAGALVRTLAGLGVKARFLYTPHAYYQMHGSAGNRRKRLFTAVERVLGKIGTTINVSASESAYARRELGLQEKNQRTLLTGIDCIRFHPASDEGAKLAARRRFGLPEGALLLGTVARYTPQKDPLTLYRALLPCLARNPALAFAHLGQGELFGEVDALVSAAPASVQARIFRLESSDDTPTFYQALDAFILPSRFEGLALSALEALATGLPLILTDVPGNHDLKAFPLNGMRWAPSGDAEHLGVEIDAWAAGPTIGTNHRAVTLNEFSALTAFNNLVNFYTDKNR